LEITFRTRQLERCYLHSQLAVRTFGDVVARRYIERVNIIKLSKSIDDLKKLPGLRCHQLVGDRAGQWAVNLTGFYRLIFTLEGERLEIAHIEEVSKHYEN
jgi:proteic killer suppression protein